MLNVMLVDDEPNVRQGIKMMIPWKELNLNVIAEAEDGDTGLKQIFAYKPDITIADIKMPGMSGIKMIEAARKEGLDGKFIILSGYSDFTYAKEAISLGVEEFILKPVDEDELIKALKTAYNKILNERDSAAKIEKSSEYINEETIRGLLLGDELSDDNLINSLNSKHNRFDVALIGLSEDTNIDKKTSMIESIKKFFRDYSNIEVVTIDFSGTLSVLFKGWNKNEIMATLNNLQSYCSQKLFIAVGNTVNGVNSIKLSYNSAHDIYKNKFLYMHYGIVSDEIITEENSDFKEINDYSKQLFAYIEINDTEKLNNYLDTFQSSLRQKGFSQEKTKVICITVIMDIKNRIAKSLGEKKADQFFYENLSNEIGEKISLFDIISMMKKMLTEVSNVLFGSTTKSTMEKIVQYIRNNYNQELRLELLASIFGYNSAYLGKVFHQYTGENFNNYLDEIRITEAKRLLSKEEYKVYEVAEMVGYTNINYFHNKFKKYVGISPLNYKKQNGTITDI